jgi:uncharacterized protein (DUF1501 family)
MDREHIQALTRRAFLGSSLTGIGSLALASLMRGAEVSAHPAKPRAKRVIFLFMFGGPSHLDLFDPKPLLRELEGQELPASVRGNQRFSANTIRQGRLPLVGSPFAFARHGRTNAQVSELLPHTAGIVDDIAIIRGMHTDSVNHDPAITCLLTGSLQPGRPTMGAWLSYGLGSLNRNLPEYVVLLSGGGGQPLRTRYWGTGFLPGSHQGVQLRSGGDPVLFVANPPGIKPDNRRQLLDGLRELNQMHFEATGDPEITTRIHSYEMAFRMQTSVPELMDISRESAGALETYGAEPGRASFAANCLLARRLAERDVRFIQLYHRDWDHHGDLPGELRKQCLETDRPAAALVRDLKQRGLLDDTLVIWGGEFGRTPFGQGPITPGSFGRDHHPRCFTIWMAGGGIRPGTILGQTDDFGFNILTDPMHVHDLQATILHCLGVDHTRLTYRFQGRDFRLTDVGGQVVHELLL